MDTTIVVVAAIVIQGIFCFALLLGIRWFGLYTRASQESVLQGQQQILMTATELFNQADDLARLRAQLVAERRDRRHPPEQSEEVVA